MSHELEWEIVDGIITFIKAFGYIIALTALAVAPGAILSLAGVKP